MRRDIFCFSCSLDDEQLRQNRDTLEPDTE